jgi:hypothetical protein
MNTETKQALYIFTHQAEFDRETVARAIDTLGNAGLLDDGQESGTRPNPFPSPADVAAGRRQRAATATIRRPRGQRWTG